MLLKSKKINLRLGPKSRLEARIMWRVCPLCCASICLQGLHSGRRGSYFLCPSCGGRLTCYSPITVVFGCSLIITLATIFTWVIRPLSLLNGIITYIIMLVLFFFPSVIIQVICLPTKIRIWNDYYTYNGSLGLRDIDESTNLEYKKNHN